MVMTTTLQNVLEDDVIHDLVHAISVPGDEGSDGVFYRAYTETK